MLVVTDIETTGLDRHHDEIVQFAALRMTNNFVPVEAQCFYLWHPGITWGAENIHHIAEATAKKEEHRFDANIRAIIRLLSYTPNVTHNGVAFDIPFLKSYLKRMGLDPGTFSNDKTVECMWGPSYDTMKIYQPVFQKRMKLGDLVAELGITEDIIGLCCKQFFGNDVGYHDASYDVTATALAFIQAAKRGLV